MKNLTRIMKQGWVIGALCAALLLGYAAPAALAQKPAPAAGTGAAAQGTGTTPSTSTPNTSTAPTKTEGSGFLSKQADVLTTSIFTLLSVVLDAAMNLVGELIVFLFDFIVFIAQYNNFTNAEIVRMGWPIVRDLVNLFFVIALLIISFATVLRIESYSYQKLLPRLVIVALLVNFSKLITGLVIDFSQVIMITFVNAFKDTAGKAFYDMFSLDSFIKSNPYVLKTDATYGQVTQNFVGKLFGFIFVLILLPVLVVFAIALAYRMVALWMLTILSPLAFFSAIFSGGKGGGGGHH